MAFYDDTEEEENLEGPQATSAQSSAVGASGAPGAATSAPGGASEPKAEPFVGISQYINANKPQSEKLAGQVVGNIDQKAGAADSALNNSQNSFNAAADAQKVAANDDLLNQVKTNAVGVAGDDEKKNSFSQLRDAKYTGPQGLEDLDGGSSWAGIQSALKKAQDSKAAAGTEEGRMGLIKEISNNPRQSQGALTFDNLLLQSNPNAAGMLQNAGASLQDFDARSSQAQTSAAAKAKEIADNNSAVSTAAKGAVTSGYQGLKDELTGKEAALDTQQQKFVADLKKAISEGNLSPEQLQALGMSGDTKTYGVNLGDYVDYVDGTDANSVATVDDLARQQALQSLAGDVDLGGDFLNSSSPLGQYGTGYNVRTNDFTAAQTAAQQQYQQLTTAPGAIDALGIPSIYDHFKGQSNAPSKGAGEADKAESLDSLINKYSKANNVVSQRYLREVLMPAKERITGSFDNTLNNQDYVGGVQGQLSGPRRMGV